MVTRALGTALKAGDEALVTKLKVSSRVYSTNAGVVTAEFVEGVLIRYTITSN